MMERCAEFVKKNDTACATAAPEPGRSLSEAVAAPIWVSVGSTAEGISVGRASRRIPATEAGILSAPIVAISMSASRCTESALEVLGAPAARECGGRPHDRSAVGCLRPSGSPAGETSPRPRPPRCRRARSAPDFPRDSASSPSRRRNRKTFPVPANVVSQKRGKHNLLDA
jgi:hypothetical protein